MKEGRLTLRDGRTVAWCEYGPHGGRPVLRFQGMPGSRFSRHPHEDSYERLEARVIIADRPGYGASSRLPGRGIAAVADDAAELLRHLGIESVHTLGGSGGGPHVLAFAARHPSLVQAATVLVGMAPMVEEDTAGLIGLNQAGWHAAKQGWDALFELLVKTREDVLADPLAGFRGLMAVAPPADKAVMEDPAWQRVLVEDLTEALRPGAEGWTDEGMALLRTWDFDPADAGCSITWWHAEHDANAPISAVRRLVARMPNVDLRVWSEAGHLEGYRRHDEILAELISR